MGSGKSTVAQEFARLGCAVIDADRINHENLEKPSTIARIRDLFGPEVFGPDGRIDYKALGNKVFSNPEAVARLNGLLHPLVLERQAELIAQYQQDDRIKAIVLDVPLLLEVGWQDICDSLVFVDAPESVRYERLRKNRDWDEKTIKKRENFQIPLDKKKKLAENVISNNSPTPDLACQVEEVLSRIVASFERKRALGAGPE